MRPRRPPALKPEAGEVARLSLQGDSSTDRITLGARRGQKALTLQTLLPRGAE
jgi:hypothetical protein